MNNLSILITNFGQLQIFRISHSLNEYDDIKLCLVEAVGTILVETLPSQKNRDLTVMLLRTVFTALKLLRYLPEKLIAASGPVGTMKQKPHH